MKEKKQTLTIEATTHEDGNLAINLINDGLSHFELIGLLQACIFKSLTGEVDIKRIAK